MRSVSKRRAETLKVVELPFGREIILRDDLAEVESWQSHPACLITVCWRFADELSDPSSKRMTTIHSAEFGCLRDSVLFLLSIVAVLPRPTPLVEVVQAQFASDETPASRQVTPLPLATHISTHVVDTQHQYAQLTYHSQRVTDPRVPPPSAFRLALPINTHRPRFDSPRLVGRLEAHQLHPITRPSHPLDPHLPLVPTHPFKLR